MGLLEFQEWGGSCELVVAEQREYPFGTVLAAWHDGAEFQQRKVRYFGGGSLADDDICPERLRRFLKSRGDVHDVGAYTMGGTPRPLAPGFVMTIEPGLYFAPDDDSVPAEYRGIGIRIEDDVLVTHQGCDVLTADIPCTVDELARVQRGT